MPTLLGVSETLGVHTQHSILLVDKTDVIDLSTHVLCPMVCVEVIHTVMRPTLQQVVMTDRTSEQAAYINLLDAVFELWQVSFEPH